MGTLFAQTSSAERLAVRRRVFIQQDGLALVPILAAFVRRRVFDSLRDGIDVLELTQLTAARRGYLNIALRALASSGWLEGWKAPRLPRDLEQPLFLKLTPAGRAAADLLTSLGSRLDRLESFCAFAERVDDYLFNEAAAPEAVPGLLAMSQWIRAEFDLDQPSHELGRTVRDRVVTMLEGLVAAPLAVALARHRLVRIQGSGVQTQVGDEVVFSDRVGPIDRRRFRTEGFAAMRALGWMDEHTSHLTADGRLTIFYASAYAVTLSYLPLLRRVEELIFRHGEFATMFAPSASGHETHVDRSLNIWGSGGAHDLYFRKVDEIIVDLFDRPDHPRAICDTGCGDGSYLRHLAGVLRDRLGWDFFARPVHFIGSDLNEASRERSRQTLASAGVPNAHIVDVPVDISDPAQLAAGIDALGLETLDSGRMRRLNADDALHTCSMLIHNRVFEPPRGPIFEHSETDGAFVDTQGFAIPGAVLQTNLIQFMRRWAPLVRRHGWLFIELHTLPAARVAEDPGRTPTIAYDLTHGFSTQYTVEHAELLAAAAAAGLVPGPARYSAKFPDGDLARVSITYLIGDAKVPSHNEP